MSKILIFGIIAFTALIRGNAYAGPKACARLFSDRGLTAFETELAKDLRTPEDYSQRMQFSSTGGSVRAMATLPGTYGGTKILAERTPGLAWMNTYAAVEYGTKSVDAQGDPRAAVIVLGYDLAEIAGVQVLDENRLVLADPLETNGHLAAFDRFLKAQNVAPIAVRLYVLPKEVKGALNRLQYYLEQLSQNGALPVESPLDAWTHFLHDVSFHRHFLVAHPELLEKFKIVAASQLQFWLFAREFFDQNLSKEHAYVAKRALIYKFADQLDFANALMMQSNIYLVRDPYKRAGSNDALTPGKVLSEQLETMGYMQQLERSFGSRKSPLKLIKEVIEDIEHAYLQQGPSTDKHYLFGLQGEQRLTRFPVGIWKSALNEFQVSQPGAGFSKPVIKSDEELLDLAVKQVERRSLLMQMAAKFNQLQPADRR